MQFYDANESETVIREHDLIKRVYGFTAMKPWGVGFVDLYQAKLPPGILSTWKVPHVLPEWTLGVIFCSNWKYVQVCKGTEADGGFAVMNKNALIKEKKK